VHGGGIEASGSVTVKNVLCAKGPNGPNCEGFTGGSFCLSDDNTCAFGGGRDDVGNLLLGPLTDNGGLTQTHLPQVGSAATDNATGSGAPASDQRGFFRSGAAPDVGAVEVAGIPLRITSISRLGDGHILLQGTGNPGMTHSVQESDTSPAGVTTVDSAVANSAGVLQYNDAGAVGKTMRFYRVTYP
jgi:hypothetical protein